MSLLPAVKCCKCNNAEGSCCASYLNPATGLCIEGCTDTIAGLCRDDQVIGLFWRDGVFCTDLEEEQGCGNGRCCAARFLPNNIDHAVEWISCTDNVTMCQCFNLGVAYEAANPTSNPSAPSNVKFKWYEDSYGLTCATDTANPEAQYVPCSPVLGQCCYTVVEPGAPQDCETICDDEIEEYECTTLGGEFIRGAQCTYESCKGVCCVTTAENVDPALSERFVSCSDNVTECECISDNLSVDLKVHFYMGNDRKCTDIDIQCPCLCPIPAYSILPILTTRTQVNFQHSCNVNNCDLTYTTVDANYLDGAFVVYSNGSSIYGPNYISDTLAYMATLGASESYTYYCELNPSIVTEQVTVTYSAITGTIVHPSSKCVRTPITQPNNVFTQTCTPAPPANAGCPQGYKCGDYPTGNSTTAQSWDVPYCSTCQQANCFHEVGDCDNC